jgi:hypothetical protein
VVGEVTIADDPELAARLKPVTRFGKHLPGRGITDGVVFVERRIVEHPIDAAPGQRGAVPWLSRSRLTEKRFRCDMNRQISNDMSPYVYVSPEECVNPPALVATNRYEARISCSLLDGWNRSSVDYILATCDRRGSVRDQECH